MPILTFNKIDERGTGIFDLALFMSGALLVIGAVVPFVGTQPPRWGISLLLLAIGLTGVVWVFRRLPQTKYFVYFTLDDRGIHHRTAPLSSFDVIPWRSVIDARARYAIEEGERHCVQLHLRGPMDRRNPRLLEMSAARHVDAAVLAIRDAIATKSLDDALQRDAAAAR